MEGERTMKCSCDRLPLGLTLALAISWLTATTTCGKAQQANLRPMGRVEVRELDETSGLVASRKNPDVLWMHNDGAAPRLYALNTKGKHVATLDVAVILTDTEDIAIGPGPDKQRDYLYIGDIGDNEAQRKAIRVCRVPEPELDPAKRAHLRATDFEEFLLKLPGGAEDCEALLVDPASGDVYIVTKEKKKGKIYMVPGKELREGETIPLKLVLNLKVKKISGGDISPDGTKILLRNESDGWLWHRQPSESIVDTLATQEAQEVQVRTQSQARNGESVGFSADSEGYFTISEGKQQPVTWFRAAAAPPSTGE